MKANRIRFDKIKYNPLNFNIRVDNHLNYKTNGESIRVELEYMIYGVTKKFYCEYIELTEKQRMNGNRDRFTKEAYYKILKKKNDIIKNQSR